MTGDTWTEVDMKPQWSPPLKGGSTADHVRDGGRVCLAAMEPAVERREHKTCSGRSNIGSKPPQWSPLKGGSTRYRMAGGRADGLAAMEPAVERREHPG